MRASWWRTKPKIEVATNEQLLARVEQLERKLKKNGGRVLHTNFDSYDTTKNVALIRDEEDKIQGIFDPRLGEFMLDPEVKQHGKNLLDGIKIPDSIAAALEKSAAERWGDLPGLKASSVGWRDVLTPRRVLAASGTQIANTVTETILCPDFTFAADYFEVGDAFKYTILFEQSTVITTPGTQTYRLRYGGVAGTAMATSGAFAPDPTAAATSVSMMLEFWFVCRSVGSAGSFMTMGRYTPNDHDDASATTIKGNLDMQMIPVSAPAAVGSLDTTTAKAISPTYQSSVSTSGSNATSHISVLESLN